MRNWIFHPSHQIPPLFSPPTQLHFTMKIFAAIVLAMATAVAAQSQSIPRTIMSSSYLSCANRQLRIVS